MKETTTRLGYIYWARRQGGGGGGIEKFICPMINDLS